MSEIDLSQIFPFTATQLGDQIDVIPNLYGLVGELGLFPEQGSSSRIVELRYDNHILRVLPAKERGAPGTPQQSRTAKSIFVEIPHFPEVDMITPADIQDVLIQVGNTKRPSTVAEEVGKRLIDIKRTHDVTLEWLKCTALQGQILDGNSSEIYDLYDVFGVEKATVYFDLANADADPLASCAEVWQAITGNLLGEVMTGIEAIVDPAFFQALITHPKVLAYYQQAEQALALANLIRQESTGQMWGRTFRHGQVLFREYYGTAPVKSSPTAAITSTPFWASNTGTAYPRGTSKMLRVYNGPAHDLREVNRPGAAVYISPKILDHGEGIELKSQSNPLPVVRRPAAIVQLSGAAE
jgi:hypothetical protein